MFKSLTSKLFFDKRGFLIGWSLGMMAMIALALVFYPSLSQGNGIEQLLGSVPKQLQGLLGDLASYKTAAGYLGSAVFELRVPLVTLPMAIILGVSLGVSEEVNGQLYQLLAQPISRSRIVLEKWLVFMMCMLIVHTAGLVAIVGTMAVIHHSVSLSVIGSVLLMSLLLCVAVGSVTLLLGFVTGKKGFATTIASSVVFGGYLVTSFAAQVSWLKSIDYLSLFHYYHPSVVVKYGLSMTHLTTYIGVIIVCIVASIIGFSRRDIGLGT